MPFGDLDGFRQFLVTFPLIVVALTFHEFGHALTADLLGDPTPRRAGRLSLNPLAHLDPLGTVMMLVAHIGWAKPVPVDPRNLRTRWGASAVSLAGPLANLLLAVLSLLFLKHVSLVEGGVIQQGLITFAVLNLILMVFNLVPIPPLDGFNLWNGFLPVRWQRALYGFIPYGLVFVVVLVFAGRFFPGVLNPLSVATDWLFDALLRVLP